MKSHILGRKGASVMTKFISNVNKYLSEMKIKQTYLSMITGIDKNKMSRLLTGSQEESGTDMEKIASGLGKSVYGTRRNAGRMGKSDVVKDFGFCAKRIVFRSAFFKRSISDAYAGGRKKYWNLCNRWRKSLFSV